MGLISWLFALPQALYAASPENGKTVYQTFCVACHTIGGGKLIGPDLKGISSKREESWLVRWIQEPDKMLAEGDPIATQLLKEFNNVPMANFGISEEQAKDILAYIEAESQGGGTSATATPEPAPVTTKPAPIQEVDAKRFTGNSENGKTIFQTKCFYCHTIGGGRLAGPDLKEAVPQREESWLVRWIVAPNKMVEEKDPIALGLLPHYRNITMPTLNLSDTEAQDVLTYIEAQSASQTATDDEELLIAEGEMSLDEPLIAPSKPAGNPEIGKALFLGQKSLANGAPACISCHSNTEIGGLGGGTLGPDLTKVLSRYGGDIGLSSVLLSMPFPTMQPVFSKKTVNKEEVEHLSAYFAQTDQLDEKRLDIGFIWLGIAGVILFYILVHLIWSNRLTSVRKTMVGR